MRARADAVTQAATARRDWSARARSSAAHALRYSKFVGVMKRALPAAAFAVIASVLVFFFAQRQPRRLALGYERLGHIENDLAMVKPQLSGTDAKGNPFVITADAAIQDKANPKKAMLRNVQADLALGGQNWLDASAATGMVDMRSGRLSLNGGLSLFSQDGYEIQTAHADVDLKAGIVRGSQRVSGHGPLGSFSADHFQADRGTGQILLGGHVHMTLDRRGGGKP